MFRKMPKKYLYNYAFYTKLRKICILCMCGGIPLLLGPGGLTRAGGGTPLLLGPGGLTRAGGGTTSPPGASSAQAGYARRCRCLKPPRATAHPTAPPCFDAWCNSAGRVVTLFHALSCASCGVRRWSTDPGALVPFMFLFSLVGGKAPPRS